ncbi:hypothetical protein LTR05_000338 [Lithohypha guttulata]|uniref:Mid2 domain-containing protein n=1 Tax=Lithohypha guttulata TaxID=1690604 RepID=A0AAN7YJB4_9EURO|nr:hypothetical protein LTR05_000338 [Lithohypha guttulata]
MSQFQWIVPPPFGAVGDYSNLPNFALDDTYTLQWTTNPEPNTILWLIKDGDDMLCEAFNLAKTGCSIIRSGNNGLSFDWQVQTYNFTYNKANPVYYMIMSTSDYTRIGYSHYLNILPESLMPASATTSSTATSSAATSSAATSSAATSSAASTISTASANSVSSVSSIPSTSSVLSTTSSTAAANPVTTSTTSSAPAATSTEAPSGLSSGTKTAIGVAVGIGIPLIAVLGLIAFLLHRNSKRKHQKQAAHVYVSHQPQPPAYREDTTKQTQPNTRRVEEMSAADHQRNSMPSELSGSPYFR